MSTHNKTKSSRPLGQKPKHDTEKLKKQVQHSVSHSDQTQFPETFCYVNDKQEVIEVNTATKVECVIGSLNSQKNDETRIENVKIATLEIVRQGLAQTH